MKTENVDLYAIEKLIWKRSPHEYGDKKTYIYTAETIFGQLEIVDQNRCNEDTKKIEWRWGYWEGDYGYEFPAKSLSDAKQLAEKWHFEKILPALRRVAKR